MRLCHSVCLNEMEKSQVKQIQIWSIWIELSFDEDCCWHTIMVWAST